MQQRQLRLGDILDDYCPRERRVTNHAVVAMVGDDVKQTRCTTCDAEHDYKHAKVPRQRKKTETPAALYAQVAATGPKIAHPSSSNGSATNHAPEHADHMDAAAEESPVADDPRADGADAPAVAAADADKPSDDVEDGIEDDAREHGPVHRPLIRASLPRPEGQQPPARPIPEFTIRQPAGRPGRFRPRNPRGGGQVFQGNRSNGNLSGPPRGMRPGGGGRPQQGGGGMARRHGPGRHKRSK